MEQPQTRQFQRWFGKSKAVDLEGKPLILRHEGNTLNRRGGAYWFDPEKGSEEGAIEAYLKLEKPYRAAQIPDSSEAERELIKQARAGGYDGVIVGKGAQTRYAVFDKTQVKSATDNIGLFDPENENIQYALALH